MSRKRLCILIPKHWSAFMGGSQYQVKCLLETFIVEGRFKIHYLTKQAEKSYRSQGYNLHIIPSLPLVSFHRFYFDYFSVLRILKTIKPHVIYQRVGCAYTGIAARYAKKNKCRMVWHVAHDDDVTPAGKEDRVLKIDIFNQKLLEYGIRNATGIITQTQHQALLLESNYRRVADAVIPNFHPYPSENIEKSNPLKIVWIANFKPWKQPEWFIQLAVDLEKKMGNVEFIMIGAPSPNKAWMRDLHKRMDPIRNLNYLGPKPIKSVNQVLAKSHIFVNTSQAEGFANTFIQAWMRNVPVISLHCNPDGVFDKEDIGYHAGSYERMLEYVIKLIKNSELREAMGKKAREYAYRVHSVKNAKQILDVLLG